MLQAPGLQGRENLPGWRLEEEFLVFCSCKERRVGAEGTRSQLEWRLDFTGATLEALWVPHRKSRETPHSSILAWRIPGTEEPSGLPSVGSHRVGHD